MAVVKRNIIVEGLSGSLGGQIVFQKGRGGRTMPTPSERAPTERQLTNQARFREASAYASQGSCDLCRKSQRHKSNRIQCSRCGLVPLPRNRPDRLEPVGWRGRRNFAYNVYVERVNVLITDENGELVETGSACQCRSKWHIVAIRHHRRSSWRPRRRYVSASDLPGNEGSLEVSKEVT